MKVALRFIGIILIIVILSRLKLDSVFKILGKTDIKLFLLAAILNIPMLFLKILRWQFLLRMQKIIYPVKQAVLSYMASIYIGFITPGRLGELIKAQYVRSDIKGVSLSRAFSSVLADRVFDLYVLLLLGISGFWVFSIFGSHTLFFVIALFILTLLPFVFLNRRLGYKLLNAAYKINFLKKMQSHLDFHFHAFYDGISDLLHKKLIFAFIFTILSYLIFFYQCKLLAMSLRIDISYCILTVAMAIANVVTFIPISFSGIGTRDAALIYLFSLKGIEKELAFSFSILVFITFFVTCGLIGLFCWLIKPLELKLRKG